MTTGERAATGEKGLGNGNGARSARGWRPRLRHWRGHGIHSPLVYSLVRGVFMHRALAGGDTVLYDALISHGVRRSVAVRLHNLYHFCGYQSFSTDGAAQQNASRCDTPGARGAIRPDAQAASRPDTPDAKARGVRNTDRTDTPGADICAHGCLRILTPLAKPEDIEAFSAPAPNDTLCVITGRCARKKRICRKMVDNHPGVSIDSKGFFLYFYARPQRKQHYKI